MRNIVVLGSTGSIGRQTLDIALRFREHVQVVGLAAHSNVDLLKEQARVFQPRYVSVSDARAARDYGLETEGQNGMAEMATAPDVDLVVVGTAGAAGLLPTLAALDSGKMVALANKETLVMAGPVIRERIKLGGRLVPIDSEHSAIWQCLQGEPRKSIERLTLTASGGALRQLPTDRLSSVTPEQALKHPTWSMGPKITIDSATLMNKGLEMLEAIWLFDVPIENVGIVMHAESIVHSLVYFDDSSVKAQLGLPDMRLPIQYALSHPDRWTNDLARLDLADVGTLQFGPLEWDRYPCLRLALQAGKEAGTYPAVLCAADEVAVRLFLEGRVRFTDIPWLIKETLSRHEGCARPELDDILQADRMGRETCQSLASDIDEKGG